MNTFVNVSLAPVTVSLSACLEIVMTPLSMVAGK